jgi:hypothetical protein
LGHWRISMAIAAGDATAVWARLLEMAAPVGAPVPGTTAWTLCR